MDSVHRRSLIFPFPQTRATTDHFLKGPFNPELLEVDLILPDIILPTGYYFASEEILSKGGEEIVFIGKDENSEEASKLSAEMSSVLLTEDQVDRIYRGEQ